MPYAECFILPVVAARFEEYRTLAVESAAIWKELGALSVMEAKAENAPVGELTSFPRSVQLRDEELVVVSYITFRDRAHRDQVMEAAMKDPRFERIMREAPTDGKRMIWGGFEPFVSV